MIHWLWMLVMVLPADPATDAVAAARFAISKQDFLMAQAALLGASPDAENSVAIASTLVEIAKSTNNFSGLHTLLTSYLDKNPAWRGVALLGLAMIAQRKDDARAFELHAIPFLNEYKQVKADAIRFRLLFYGRLLGMKETPQLERYEAAWYDALATYQAQGSWSMDRDILEHLPLDVRVWIAINFGAKSENWVFSGTDRDRYLVWLLAIRMDLEAGDLEFAIQRLNSLNALDRKLNDIQLRIWFLPLMAEIIWRTDEPERAKKVLASLQTYYGRLVLPLHCFPLVFKQTPSTPELKAVEETGDAVPLKQESHEEPNKSAAIETNSQPLPEAKPPDAQAPSALVTASVEPQAEPPAKPFSEAPSATSPAEIEADHQPQKIDQTPETGSKAQPSLPAVPLARPIASQAPPSEVLPTPEKQEVNEPFESSQPPLPSKASEELLQAERPSPLSQPVPELQAPPSDSEVVATAGKTAEKREPTNQEFTQTEEKLEEVPEPTEETPLELRQDPAEQLQTGSVTEQSGDKTEAKVPSVAPVAIAKPAEPESAVTVAPPESGTPQGATSLTAADPTSEGPQSSPESEPQEADPQKPLSGEAKSQAVLNDAIHTQAQTPAPARAEEAVAAKNVSPFAAFIRIEEALEKGDRGMELDIRALPGDSAYQRLYRNYLLGLFYLQSGRMDSAFEFLNIANRLMGDYPFPDLQYKIALALADYYQLKRDPQQEEWYRISATKIWSDPLNLPLLADPQIRRAPNPYLLTIDEILRKDQQLSDLDALLQLIAQNEFSDLRQRAYQSKLLAETEQIDHQFKELGSQMREIVAKLHLGEQDALTPRHYNHATEAWQKTWPHVKPAFRGTNPIDREHLQRRMGEKDRLYLFIEGRSQFAVACFTKTQSFLIKLGELSLFSRLDPETRLHFLEARLGIKWESEGELLFLLSPALKEHALLKQLRSAMSEPNKLRLLFSLVQFAQAPRAGVCSKNTLLVNAAYQTALPPNFQKKDTLIQDPNHLDPASWVEQLGPIENLLIAGKFEQSEEGPCLVSDSSRLPLLQLGHSSQKICAIFLLSEHWDDWLAFYSDLELIAPGLEIRYQLLEPGDLEDSFGFQSNSGVRFQ